MSDKCKEFLFAVAFPIYRLPPFASCLRLPHIRPAGFYIRFRFHPVFRMYGSPIPTYGFDFFPPSARTVRQSLHAVSIASPLSARTARQFLPALSDFPLFPHVQLADPYLRFRLPTAFGFLPLSARTTRRFLPALSTSPCLPHVRLADSYLHFRFPTAFRTYNSPVPTCAFDLTLSSARTPRQSLPALSVSSHFPHVLPVNSYLRFRTFHSFRMYGSLIPTCAFGFLPFSARTARQFLHASPTTPRLSHVHPVNPYLHFRFPPIFRMYGSLTTCRICTPCPRY